MKTKIILHGGYASHENSENDKYFKEILNINKKELSILLVLFAKPESEHDEKAKKVISQFAKNNNDKFLKFEIAQMDKFVNQIQEADVVYLHGGKTLDLLKALRRVNNLSELVKDKTVAGESAGAYVLSSCFYSKSLEKCFEGLNFVPVKTICHYEGKNKEMLSSCHSELEELLLENYKFKIFNY